MTEQARLVIAVDAKGVKTATDDLKKLGDAAGPAEAKAAASRQAQDAYASQVRADAGTLAADRDSLVREIVGKTKELADIEKALQKARDKIALLIA